MKKLTQKELRFIAPCKICMNCAGKYQHLGPSERPIAVKKEFGKIPAECILLSSGVNKDGCPFAE